MSFFVSGIIWSFKFPSIDTLTRKRMPPAVLKPHMDVMQWLAALDLKQYSSNFEKFDGVEVRNIFHHLNFWGQ